MVMVNVKPATPSGYKLCCCPDPVGVGVGVGVGDSVGDSIGVGLGCNCLFPTITFLNWAGGPTTFAVNGDPTRIARFRVDLPSSACCFEKYDILITTSVPSGPVYGYYGAFVKTPNFPLSGDFTHGTLVFRSQYMTPADPLVCPSNHPYILEIPITFYESSSIPCGVEVPIDFTVKIDTKCVGASTTNPSAQSTTTPLLVGKYALNMSSSISSTSINVGGTTYLTITINNAGSYLVNNITFNYTATGGISVIPPASVTVPPCGSTTVTFQITGTSPGPATITIIDWNGTSGSAPLSAPLGFTHNITVL